MISGCQPAACVDDEKHQVGLPDGGRRTKPHAAGQRFGGRFLKTCRVHHDKLASSHLGLGFLPVARHPRRIGNECGSPSDQSIEQGRFSDVGPSGNDHDWKHVRKSDS